MIRAFRPILTTILAATVLCGALVAQAAEPSALPATLTIHYHSDDQIGGAEFSVVRVAEATWNETNGVYDYTLVNEFQGTGIDPGNIASDAAAAAARTLAGAYTNSTLAGKITTGSDGKASLEVTQAGLYLVWQSGRTGTASRYYAASPMLVYLPSPQKDSNTVTWTNAATLQPKTSKIPSGGGGGGDDGGHDGGSSGTTPTRQTTETGSAGESIPEIDEIGAEETVPEISDWGSVGDTGDNSHMMLWGGIALVCIAVLAAYGVIRRRHH